MLKLMGGATKVVIPTVRVVDVRPPIMVTTDLINFQRVVQNLTGKRKHIDNHHHNNNNTIIAHVDADAGQDHDDGDRSEEDGIHHDIDDANGIHVTNNNHVGLQYVGNEEEEILGQHQSSMAFFTHGNDTITNHGHGHANGNGHGHGNGHGNGHAHGYGNAKQDNEVHGASLSSMNSSSNSNISNSIACLNHPEIAPIRCSSSSSNSNSNGIMMVHAHEEVTSTCCIIIKEESEEEEEEEEASLNHHGPIQPGIDQKNHQMVKENHYAMMHNYVHSPTKKAKLMNDDNSINEHEHGHHHHHHHHHHNHVMDENHHHHHHQKHVMDHHHHHNDTVVEEIVLKYANGINVLEPPHSHHHDDDDDDDDGHDDGGDDDRFLYYGSTSNDNTNPNGSIINQCHGDLLFSDLLQSSSESMSATMMMQTDHNRAVQPVVMDRFFDTNSSWWDNIINLCSNPTHDRIDTLINDSHDDHHSLDKNIFLF